VFRKTLLELPGLPRLNGHLSKIGKLLFNLGNSAPHKWIMEPSNVAEYTGPSSGTSCG